MKEERKTKILLGIYLILLIWIILFKLSFSSEELERFRRINLIPFYYSTKTNFQLREVLDNVFIFIPLGILLKMEGIENRKVIGCGFIFSFILESMQFILAIGASDITDVITNTTGTLIGLGIYLFLSKVIKDDRGVNKILNALGIMGAILFLGFISLLIMNN